MNMIENTIPFSFPHFPGVGGGGEDHLKLGF